MGLTLDASRHGDVVVLAVGGEIDVHTAPQLRDAVAEAGDESVSGIVVDLSGTEFLDSSALGVLVGANKLFGTTERGLRIVCARRNLLRVFQISHLDEVLRIHDSLDDALA